MSDGRSDDREWTGTGEPASLDVDFDEEAIVRKRESEFKAVISDDVRPTITVRETDEAAAEFEFDGFDASAFNLADARLLHVMLGKAIAEAEKWALP